MRFTLSLACFFLASAPVYATPMRARELGLTVSTLTRYTDQVRRTIGEIFGNPEHRIEVSAW